MNAKQKAVVFICALILVFMALAPPWTETFISESAHSKRAIGYFLVFDPPRPSSDNKRVGVTIDFSRLLVQWFAVALFGAMLFFVLKSRAKN